jgi:hypothetical protein
MAVALGACASSPSSSGVPPWVVCGTTVLAGAAAPDITDVSAPGHTFSVDSTTVGGIDLLLTRDCAHGVAVSIQPADAAGITRSAAASDGAMAAVTIDPRQSQFVVTLIYARGGESKIRVDLSAS